jgi:hypothetical protein
MNRFDVSIPLHVVSIKSYYTDNEGTSTHAANASSPRSFPQPDILYPPNVIDGSIVL